MSIDECLSLSRRNFEVPSYDEHFSFSIKARRMERLAFLTQLGFLKTVERQPNRQCLENFFQKGIGTAEGCSRLNFRRSAIVSLVTAFGTKRPYRQTPSMSAVEGRPAVPSRCRDVSD
jgi:hypothetical protein